MSSLKLNLLRGEISFVSFLLFDLNLALSVGPVVTGGDTGAVGDLLHQGGGGGVLTQIDPLVASWFLRNRYKITFFRPNSRTTCLVKIN